VRTIDLESWPRRELYENFRTYGDPFFNITAEIDVTDLVRFSRKRDQSFFIVSYYVVLKIVNEIEEFRLRMRDDEVVIHDVVHGSCTVLNTDETFSACLFEFRSEFVEFRTKCNQVLEENRRSMLSVPFFHRDDVIHSSVIPWLRFTSFEHAKRLGKPDSCPKIVLGRFHEVDGRFLMPVSVSGHHALMDGIHAARFFQKYEQFSADIDQVIG
jgi:chloramphenicol O-acetyltransferase type A